MPGPHPACCVHSVPYALACVEDRYVAPAHAKHVDTLRAPLSRYLCPAAHVGCVVHVALRWKGAAWYSLAGHATHTPAAPAVALARYVPSLQMVCGLHSKWACRVSFWYVWVGQTSHALSTDGDPCRDRYSPTPHAVLALHAASLSSGCHASAGHASHTRSRLSACGALMYEPLKHVVSEVQVRRQGLEHVDASYCVQLAHAACSRTRAVIL